MIWLFNLQIFFRHIVSICCLVCLCVSVLVINFVRHSARSQSSIAGSPGSFLSPGATDTPGLASFASSSASSSLSSSTPPQLQTCNFLASHLFFFLLSFLPLFFYSNFSFIFVSLFVARALISPQWPELEGETSATFAPQTFFFFF